MKRGRASRGKNQAPSIYPGKTVLLLFYQIHLELKGLLRMQRHYASYFQQRINTLAATRRAGDGRHWNEAELLRQHNNRAVYEMVTYTSYASLERDDSFRNDHSSRRTTVQARRRESSMVMNDGEEEDKKSRKQIVEGTMNKSGSERRRWYMIAFPQYTSRGKAALLDEHHCSACYELRQCQFIGVNV